MRSSLIQNLTDMLKLTVPSDFSPERKYIIKVIFQEYLGLDYSLETEESLKKYIIILPNQSRVEIIDGFFSNINIETEYLKEEYIPKKIEFSNNNYTIENDIPIIFGNGLLKKEQIAGTNNKLITCHIDIFASSFYMLTRWEEHVIKDRDEHDRFPYSSSLAFKEQFLSRPIVNEYVEMLFNIMIEADPQIPRRSNQFKVHLSHDIDYIKYKPSLREFAGDIIKRHSFKEFLRRLWFGFIANPYNSYEFLMSQSDELGLKSTFNLMSGGSHKLDYGNYIESKKLSHILKKILARGHMIGFHPSYLTLEDYNKLEKEKSDLEKVTGKKITEGRQHYLRFEVPYTWRNWNKLGLQYDSTLSYAHKHGFRCGTCYEYSVFDIIERKNLELKEKPLIAMDTTFVSHQNMNPDQMENEVLALINTVKKFNGEFGLLWHTSSFNINTWGPYKKVYMNIISYLARLL